MPDPIIDPTPKVETPETPQDKPVDNTPAPKPESNEDGYYKRQFDKLSKKVEAFEKAEEDRKKAEMTEVDRLKAESAEKDAKLTAATSKANERLIKAEARAAAAASGIKPEKLDYALRLADLSAIEIGEDGEVPANEVKAAIDAVLKDLPELASKPGNIGAGAKGAPSALTDAIIAKMKPEELKARMTEVQSYYASKR